MNLQHATGTYALSIVLIYKFQICDSEYAHQSGRGPVGRHVAWRGHVTQPSSVEERSQRHRLLRLL